MKTPNSHSYTQVDWLYEMDQFFEWICSSDDRKIKVCQDETIGKAKEDW